MRSARLKPEADAVQILGEPVELSLVELPGLLDQPPLRVGSLVEGLVVEEARFAGSGPPLGMVQAADGRLFVGCADGALELLRVRPAGKRSMAVTDYLRGHAPAARVAA